jgi:hypothetical protein
MVHSPETITGLVSTNSVTQGELAYYMWSNMLPKGATIRFAHRTFQWNNEARGNAAVHCVIIGYSVKPTTEKYLFYYPDIKGDPVRSTVKNISPYLTESGNTLIPPRTSPIRPVRSMVNGSKPTDGGHLLMNEAEKNELVQKEPGAEKWIRRFAMGEEFINDIKKYCLWLPEITPDELRQLPLVMKRVEAVRNMRLASKDKQTQTAAGRSNQFQAIRQPAGNYLALPRVSSENRHYVPIGFLDKDFIADDKLQLIPDATLYDFGVVTAEMHMIWMKAITGRLESRYQYSASIVYNNFPWPESPTELQKQAVEEAAQAVLDNRAKYPDSSLATLYNPLTMPGDLLKAHQQLDKAVDKCYRKEPFKDNRERIAYLFGLYEKYMAGLLAGLGEKKRKVGK